MCDVPRGLGKATAVSTPCYLGALHHMARGSICGLQGEPGALPGRSQQALLRVLTVSFGQVWITALNLSYLNRRLFSFLEGTRFTVRPQFLVDLIVTTWEDVFWVPNDQLKNTFCPASSVNAKNMTTSSFLLYSLLFLVQNKAERALSWFLCGSRDSFRIPPLFWAVSPGPLRGLRTRGQSEEQGEGSERSVTFHGQRRIWKDQRTWKRPDLCLIY